MKQIKIDEIRIGLLLPDFLISQRFDDFLIRESSDCEIIVSLGEEDMLDDMAGECFECSDSDFSLTKIGEGRIRTFFHSSDVLKGLNIIPGHVYCIPKKDITLSAEDADGIFDLMKGGIFYLLKDFGYYVLHCASVIYDGLLYAFSAPSGTGKTTHIGFWNRLFGAETYNGDMLILKAGEEKPHAYPLPWSGESGISMTSFPEIGGIFFIERGEKNEIRPLGSLEASVMLTQRLLSCNTDHSSFIKNANALFSNAEKIPCAVLSCLPDGEAAVLARNYADTEMRKK